MQEENIIDKSEAEEKKAKDTENSVSISFRVPSKMPSVYATHFFVQDSPDEVVLSFFELIHPILPPEVGEERDRAVERLKQIGVTAECVARVTVAKHKFPAFAQAMATTAERIIEEFERLEENADNQSNNREN